MAKIVGNATGQANDITVATGTGVIDADTQRVVLATDQPVVPVSVASLPLPAGAATDGTDGTAPPAVLGAGTGIRGWLRSIYEKLTGSIAVTGTFWQATQPVSIAANTPTLQAGSTTAVTQAAGTNLHTVIDSGTVTTVSAVTAITNALPVGANVIGKVSIDQTTPGTTNLVALAANQSVNVAQVNGVAPTMGNGVAGVGVQRVTLASDGTGQVTLAAGVATIGALTSNQSVNNAQVNGVALQTGTGVASTGTQRVAVASDSSIVIATGANTIGAVNIAAAQTLATVTTVGAVTAITNALPVGTNLLGKIGIDQTTPGTTNAVVANVQAAAAATLTNVASSATNATILAANTARKGVILYNDSTQVLYLKFGATASTTSFTYYIAAGGTWEMPAPVYVGGIDGLWAAANGSARFTELT